MSSATSLLDPILACPFAPKLLRILKKHLKKEQKKRKAFYKLLSEGVKAEFINGETVIQSSETLMHNRASGSLVTAMGFYANLNKLGEVYHATIMIELSRNSYEPDISFFSKKKAKKFHPELMFFPAPDLIVEVLSEETEVRDRGIKWEDYAAHNVKEYWIVDPKNRSVEQYIEHGGKYVLEVKLTEGLLHSKAIKGFSITVAAIFDEKENVKAIVEMLNK